MKFPEFTEDLSIISKLGDNPGADNGLTAEGLKAKFDEGPLALQRFLNSVLIAKLNEIFVAGGQLNEGLIMTGPINMNQNILFGLADPKNDSEAVNFRFAQKNYAPSGYGLGESEIIAWENIDSVWQNGWYLFSGGFTVQGQSYYAGYLHVCGWDKNNCEQTLYPVGAHNEVLRRHKNSGSWTEWEWENPPMYTGIEFRTTERYNGKTVWTTLISCGVPVNGATTTFPFSYETIFRLTGVLGTGVVLPYTETGNMADDWRGIWLSIDGDEITIHCNGGREGYGNVVCQIWYTKG